MNRSAFRFLIIATVLLLAPYAAIAQDNHSNGSYTCAICHSTHNTLGSLGLNNICLTCHAPGTVSSKGGRIPPFSFGDMADPFGTLPGSKLQSSHKWTGVDEVPAAGALPPTDVNMTDPAKYAYLLGSLSCARCHKINGSFDSTTNSAPYLRTLNDKDQMCLDCHRPRNTRSHLTGTHPVNFNYTGATSKVKTRPGEYYSLPVNSNPANPTAAMQLKNGALLCTTCHGVHHTDSNSSTFDNNSSAVFGHLSTSKGYLLRTDLHGSSADAANICTNCHRPYDKTLNPNGKINNHNGKKASQNVQCADCHGGHVEYAGANPPANELQPNVFLINRFMNISSATGRYKTVRNAKVLYQYTSAAAKNYNKNAFGVCVACHSTLPNTVSQHSSTDASVCASCHTHRAGFSADCTTCHGMPPKTNAPGPDGYADGYQNVAGFVNESVSPHQSHALGTGSYYAFGCVECHNGNNHNSSPNTFQDVFKDKTGIKAGLTASYDPAARRCSNVYCHSNGAVPALLVYTSVTWGNNKDSFIGKPDECGKCHSATPATNAHSKHIAGGTSNKTYACITCHAATVSNNTTLLAAAKQSGGTHVNGLRDVLFSGTVGSATLSGSTCSTVYCHTDGKGGAPVTAPNWQDSNTGKCGSCHAYPMANFGHPAHLTASYGPGFGTTAPSACNQCHVYTAEGAATHVNGALDNVVNACTTCHPSGAVWSGGRVTCDSCHTGAVRSKIYNIDAPDKSQASTQGHGKPASSTGTAMAIACTTCHDQNSQHINSNPAVHTNRLAASLTGPLNTECTFCHNDAVKVPTVRFRNMSTHFKVKGGTQAMECWQCHELHGTSNLSMVRAKIAYFNSTSWTISFTNNSSAMIDTFTNRGLCQVCHTQTKYYRAGVAETGHPNKGCFSCHPHNARGGAFSPSGGTCDTCHGYPPVPKSLTKGTWDGSANTRLTTFGTFNNYTNAKYENYSGGGGAHLSHVPTSAKATQGWTNCNGCHNNGLSHKMALPRSGDWRSSTDGVIGNVTVKISPVQRFNDTFFPIYTGARLVNKPQANQTGNCMSVGCHFQPTPRWSLDR